MAVTSVKIPINTAVAYISKGIDKTIKERIKETLMEQAEKVVEEVSMEICKNLKSRLTSYEEFGDHGRDIKISLYVDREFVKEE